MKPKRIILIRHGESEANVNAHLFASVPDYAIELTEEGHKQAIEAGKRLKELVADESLYFYVSPFWRTRSTFEDIAQAFPRQQFQYSEEPRLREQEWGYLRCNEDFDKIAEMVRYYETALTNWREVREQIAQTLPKDKQKSYREITKQMHTRLYNDL